MKVGLYLVASLDGFIADKRGHRIVADNSAFFTRAVKSYGCVCMGRITYQEGYGGPALKYVHCIVLTHKLPKKAVGDTVHFVTSVEGAMAKARALGCKKMMVIGGARTNQSFMQAGVVSRALIDMYPRFLKTGLPMFGDFKASFDFKMVRHEWVEKKGFTHAEYTVGRPHTVVAVIIIRDAHGNYFAHRRRADKKVFPGRWGLGAGGKAYDTETPEAAARRELREETGLTTPLRQCFRFDYKGDTAAHTVYVFETTVRKSKEYRNPREWDMTAWMDAEQLNELARSGELCDDTRMIYEKYRETLSA